jgi:hypothetical protein
VEYGTRVLPKGYEIAILSHKDTLLKKNQSCSFCNIRASATNVQTSRLRRQKMKAFSEFFLMIVYPLQGKRGSLLLIVSHYLGIPVIEYISY